MASGNTLCVFTPAAGEPPASNYPTFDTRNTVLVLEFDQSTDETIIFRGVAPSHYSAGGFTVKIHWYGDTGLTTGDVVWGVAVERGTTDIDADSFGSAVTGTSTTNGTSGIGTTTSINLAGNMDSIVAGDDFRLKVYRDADNVADTMAGDAQLYIVEVVET